LAKYTVIFDACVLYPAPLRDLLVQLATAGLFRAKWSEKIQDEWTSNLLANRKDLKPDDIKRTVSLLNAAVPDCLVTGYEHLIPTITIPDANDRHVVAAAIHARADGIVTFNLDDFSDEALSVYNMESIHPDDFILAQTDLNEAAVVMAAQKVRARLKAPPVTVFEYLNNLHLQQLPKTVAWLGQYAGVL